jgi:hypothetical protein
MVTRTTIARIQQRIEAAVARRDPEPPKPRHPGIAWLREIAMRFGASRGEAEASIAVAAREGHAHLIDHPRHPLYGRKATEEEARAVAESAESALGRRLQNWAR